MEKRWITFGLVAAAALAAGALSPSHADASPATARAAPKAAVFCVLVGKEDLRIRRAEVAISSGDAAWDTRMGRDVVGMKAPAPTSMTSDTWEPAGFGDPAALPVDPTEADCSKLNERLCGQPSCRQAGMR